MIPILISFAILDQLQQDSMRRRRMNESHPRIVRAGSRFFVDEADSCRLEVGQHQLDVFNPYGDMMQSLAPPREEFSDRRIGPGGLEQFQPALSDIQHGKADALFFDLILPGTL